MAEPHRLTATEVVALMKNGGLTVEDYAKSLLERVKERDHVIKAWAYLDPEFVLAQARKLDQIPPEKRGPLHGVAIGVKDVILTKGSPLFINGRRLLKALIQICQRPTTLQFIKMSPQR
jgi:Asp-tRNA(Asn)/Glu-tRNA(Gln) amidotransferase A subunit family amidase